MTISGSALPMDTDRLQVLRSMQRELLLTYGEYLAAIRLLSRETADEFVRSREPLIEAMATVSDRLSAQAEVVPQAERAVA